MASESKKTVLAAFAANLVIAVAKLIGGLVSGSAAMLAEAAHSTADTFNQVFLLLSLSLGGRKPDEAHPFGYGKERFFWGLIAAVFIFVSGAVFSIAEGIERLVAGETESGDPLISYVVLAVAFVSEGAAWTRAYRQMRREAREVELPLTRYIRMSRDPAVKTALSEDTAAVIGVVLAFLGIGLHQLTGSAVWDAGASIAIGIVLAVVAILLARDTKGLLLGEAAHPHELEGIRRVIEEHDGVAELLEVLTMAVGPDALLVAARVDMREGLSESDVEEAAEEIDRALREAVPAVREVFLDPTSTRKRTGARGSR